MLFKALSAAVYGIDANLIDVEVDCSGVITDKDNFHAVGLPDATVRESRDQLKKEYGLETDYMRIRAFPFSSEVYAFVASHTKIYVIEQNRDGQMLSLLKLDLPATEVTKLRSIRYFDGLPLDARTVTDKLVLQEEI